MEQFSNLFSLPLTDPVLIFALVLLLILFSPLIFDRLHIPHIVGLIIAGILFGPNGLGLLDNDSSFRLFGQVGILYIMFIAGVDMDMNDFNHNRNKSIVFGLYTFLIPMTLGIITGLFLLNFSVPSSIVLASMFASNTLLAYPIVTRYGVSDNRSVPITVGGTMVSMLLSLLTLAVVLQVVNGDISYFFWLKFIASLTVYGLIVMFVFPAITRWFFKHYADNILQYIFVMAIVLLSSFLAKVAGMEYIIGAFLAGISLNRLIPKRSPLMNRINFVGNAIFIPFFLISVGMIVDIKMIFSGYVTIFMALVMTIMATISKYIAAQATRFTYRMNEAEGEMMFGLSNAKAAYSLAAVVLAYNTITGFTEAGNPIRLLTEEVLNGTVIMILCTCIVSSLVTERASKRLAASNVSNDKTAGYRPERRILIPISNPDTLESLMALAVILNDSKYKQPMYALNVVDYNSIDDKSSGDSDKLLERAAYIGSASDNKVKKIKRYDLNVASGITNVVREKNISEVVMGVSTKATLADTVFGSLTDKVLDEVNRMIYILSSSQPLGTVHKIVVVAPNGAEKESGFAKWCHGVLTIASQSGAGLEIRSSKDTFDAIKKNFRKSKGNITPDFIESFGFSIQDTVQSIEENDLLIAVLARRHSLSYTPALENVLSYLLSNLKNKNFIVLFPEQFKEGEIDRIQNTNTKII
ncbi:MAG: cation:proton antiporter [Paludibacteraceae bacterium]|nr:cation:proton antiporter [Paludibacteraceae bacterium]